MFDFVLKQSNEGNSYCLQTVWVTDGNDTQGTVPALVPNCLQSDLLHELQPNDKLWRLHFVVDMQHNTDKEEVYLKRVLFSNVAMVDVCGVLNNYKCRICMPENSYAFRAVESLNVSV